MRTQDEIHADYLRFRGKCKEMCEDAVCADPSLRLVRGHYFCPIWNSNQPHWWTVREDGTIYDPSALQFPSAGMGIYEEFNGMCTCAECGKKVSENEADIEGNYAFCSYLCHGRFVGIL